MGTPSFLTSALLGRAGFPHAFTTRAAGNQGRGAPADGDDVHANRAAVIRALHLDPARHVEADQVHGAAVAVVGARDAGRSLPDADGLATAEPGVVLAVHAADCLPLLFADPRTGAVAAVHAGWRGLAAGIPVEAVRVLADRFDVRAEDLLVAVGPSIGPCHYEVDEPVMARMRAWPWWEAVAPPNDRGRWQLDLRAACARQLAGEGVLPEHIDVLDLCTYHHPELFYSYRRDRASGRMAAVIAPRPRAAAADGGNA